MHKYIHIVASILLICCSIHLNAQIEKASNDDINVNDSKNVNKLSFSGGLQIEVLSLTGFGEIGVHPKVNLGVGLNFGINATNLILVAGENFSRENTINLDNTDGEKRFYFETSGVYLYTKFKIVKTIDLSVGYKLASVTVNHYYNDDGDGVNGKFNGIYIQPSLGHGRIQYAFRVMVGQLIINSRSFQQPELKEFGILMQPLILTFHFNKKR